MTTLQDALEAYKKAIRVKFEEEKIKEYSSFLLVPSRAKLRQLCIERFKNNDSSDDLKSFEIFFGFPFESGNKNKLQAATDRFRPIENFLKGESDLADIEGINMSAILLNFEPRPFKKFAKLNSDDFVEDVKGTNVAKNKSNSIIEKEEKPVFFKDEVIVASKSNLKKKVGIGSIVVFGLFGAKSMFFKEKECMEWKEDHYELVDCKGEQVEFASAKIIKPYNEMEFSRKELTVCDTTKFFNGDKPIVWYSKKNNEIQFFSMDGENPENGAELRKVTQYIIEKYVEDCE
ncbi:hypothetical protein [Flavobacterium sp.]|uniref:hypothetical protein n=1 Tax=Flavobacterium sp. TaxID=239 RepID=UPI0026093005|nr:hypothetical protein [Flavobacterium sp.]